MKRYFLSLIIALLAVPSVVIAENPQMMIQSNPRIKIVKKTIPSDSPIQSRIGAIENKMATIETELKGLNTQIDNLKGSLERTSEMSEMTSVRLQQMLDRKSKFISMLTNIMKKISATSDTIVQNLK